MDNPTYSAFNNLAKSYQEKFMDLEIYNDTYDSFCRLLEKKNAAIFEIGSGPGNITRYLLSKRQDFQAEAIDLAPNMIALARQNVPTADFKIMDCRNISSIAKKFDGIVCGFCLPYLPENEGAKLISDCSVLLNDGGIFYFSVIEDHYAKSGVEKSSDGTESCYVYYYEEDFLQKALKENNFECVEIQRKEFSKNNQPSIHLIIIARKKSI